jgi:hypothetical protein
VLWRERGHGASVVQRLPIVSKKGGHDCDSHRCSSLAQTSGRARCARYQRRLFSSGVRLSAQGSLARTPLPFSPTHCR